MSISIGHPTQETTLLGLPIRNWLYSLLLLFLFWMGGIKIKSPSIPSAPPQTPPLWGEKPLLGYFLLTQSMSSNLLDERVLTARQLQQIQDIAQVEKEALTELEMESWEFLKDPTLTLEQKREKVVAMQFNQRVSEILLAGNSVLFDRLDARTYARLKEWILERWEIEKVIHGVVPKPVSSRTYKIFATRYDSKGAYIVALPDKCLKFANAGNHICDDLGYVIGQDYTVFMSYTKSTAATVLEAGPWNIDDNYWSGIYDPQPRRMFTDLAIGMPEAQAAYFNNYNGGLDQYGRKVTAPFGIDLAPEVSNDIGLKGAMNDWITITFMWTEGWNGSAGVVSGNVIEKISIATPNPDGSIVHEVRSGQFLSSIAEAYQVNLQDLLNLNNLTKDSLIFPGDKLLIKPASISPTISPVASQVSVTKTVQPVPSKKVNNAITLTVANHTDLTTNMPSSTPEKGDQVDDTDNQIFSDPILVGIIGMVIVGTALVLLGTLVRKKNP